MKFISGIIAIIVVAGSLCLMSKGLSIRHSYGGTRMDVAEISLFGNLNLSTWFMRWFSVNRCADIEPCNVYVTLPENSIQSFFVNY